MSPTTSCMSSAAGSRSIAAITIPSRGSGASARRRPRRCAASRRRRPRSCKPMSIAGATRRTPRARRKAGSRRSPRCSRSPPSVQDASVVFDFPSPKELRPPLVVLDGVAVGYVPGAPVLSRLNLRIDPDDRVALVGRNGNGKTTLARLLAGQLQADGRRDRRHRQIAGRLFRPASDRGARCRRDAAPAYAAPVA